MKAGINSSGYFSVRFSLNKKQKTFDVHLLVAIAFLNHKPRGLKKIVEHKDQNSKNNLLSNLEITTQRVNMERHFKTKKTTSQYIGVCFNKSRNKWNAQIYIKGKIKYLGLFVTEQEAHLAYQKALASIV